MPFHPPFLDIPPLHHAAGTVRLPGSKSISNRVLLLAGLSEGTTVVEDLLRSDDTTVMLQALQTLGCDVYLDATRCTITGLGGRLAVHEAELHLGNAGTAMRPLTAALAILALQDGGTFTLDGVARMRERPIGDLTDALASLGAHVEHLAQPGYPPLRLSGRAGEHVALERPIPVRGDVSSQFLTALLLALPLAVGERDAVIEVQGELISRPYIDITLNLLARFGVDVRRDGYARFTIPRGSRYRSPGRIAVEGDASSASYFIAAGAIAAAGGAPVRIEGVGLDSIQGDIAFVDAARAMGAQVAGGPNHLLVRRGAWPLKAITLDANAIPDAAMTIAAMALYADGPVTITNIASWRVKETDRIDAMAAELRKVGAAVAATADSITVTPPQAWRDASIRTYDDHRMAMCLSLAAFNPLAVRRGHAVVRIEDPGCVAKTFPEYFDTLFSIAGAAVEDIPVITVDGPTASGKGTLAAQLAEQLGWHLLDSGSLYRATAVAARDHGVDPDDGAAVAKLVPLMSLAFDGGRIRLNGRDVTGELRKEAIGLGASRVSVHPAVRQALHGLQLSFRRAPGLVADGRDMGTVVFPDAPLKVFLTASAAERAGRRHKQLISQGISSNIDDLRRDLEARDARDMNRSVAPLVPAGDAYRLDNSQLGIDESVQQVLQWWSQRRPDGLKPG